MSFAEDIRESLSECSNLCSELVVFVFILVKHLFESQLLLVRLLVFVVGDVALGLCHVGFIVIIDLHSPSIIIILE